VAVSRFSLLFLGLLGLLVASLVAALQHSPGYMDADYYMAGGLRLAQGHGFSEIFLWNYLDDPQSLPHPSHSYWMPLASIVAALGMWLGGLDFYAARIPFILLAACVPPLTALLAFKLTSRRDLGLAAGALAAFPGFQAPFIATTDNFTIYNLLGLGIFLLLPAEKRRSFFLLGLLSGLMNLARSDGLLWAALAGLSVLADLVQKRGSNPTKWFGAAAQAGALLAAGYLLVMGPWFLRNLGVFGALMTPGGSRALWLVEYSDTFIYPASLLTAGHLLASGWESILAVRWWSFTTNIGTFIAAQGSILLFPFMLVGGWKLRSDARVRLAAFGWLVLFLVMTLIFPFAGARGSYFHAGAALMPVIWALSPLGLETIVAAARKRSRFTPQAPRIFRVSLIAINAAFALVLIYMRVVSSSWEISHQTYLDVEQILRAHGADSREAVFVANPPGYYLASQRPALAVPKIDLALLPGLAQKFEAQYLVLEPDSLLQSWNSVYESRRLPGWTLLAEENGWQVYQFSPHDP
jgi:hypothetical protein